MALIGTRDDAHISPLLLIIANTADSRCVRAAALVSGLFGARFACMFFATRAPQLLSSEAGDATNVAGLFLPTMIPERAAYGQVHHHPPCYRYPRRYSVSRARAISSGVASAGMDIGGGFARGRRRRAPGGGARRAAASASNAVARAARCSAGRARRAANGSLISRPSYFASSPRSPAPCSPG